ncbi:MAG: tRNA (N(6)-L-threonylcarbamoyladenosine(37)-C(2))-methylthiotransferase MtaB [Oscillospiraceae bacterium]
MSKCCAICRKNIFKGLIYINIHFITFGCKVNLCETENMKELFLSDGFSITDEDIAEIFVINSCTVTSMSDKKVRQEIHRLKKSYPDGIIALMGCFPQAFKEKAEEIIEADIIIGSKNRRRLPLLIKEFLIDRIRLVKIDEYENDDGFERMKNTEFEDKTRAFIKIQDGCNQFCSYCIIPYARGRIRSKSIDDLRDEVKALALSGHKEIVLVGINLSFYGKEFGLRLVDAIEACCEIDGIERVRLGSLEPEVISDEDILRLSKQAKLCPQFHLSLQSGCDKTLESMNRKYTSAEYFELVEKLRKAFPDCAITTDVMVGFPEESDEDFQKSLAFVKKVGFAKVHVFPYSRREGTVAAKRSGQIQSSVKTLRAKEMGKLSDRLQEAFLEKQVGKTFPVLFERENCTEFHQGYAPNYTLVKIPTKISDKSLRREIFYVKIEEIRKDFCIGEIQI